jgi:sugar/nucleoside kinase (ribokinase family)
MAKIAVIGHVAIDKIIDHDGERTQLGGPPTYTSVAFGVLGNDIHPITKLGEDIPRDLLHRLEELGINARGMVAVGAKTTRFVLDYTKTKRSLEVESVCEEIGPDSITDLPDVSLITPIIGELNEDAIDAIHSDVLALDPQGFLRTLKEDGTIKLQPWRDNELIGRLSVMKASKEELTFITGEVDPRRGLERIMKLGAGVAVATLGREGSIVSEGGRLLKVPAYESDSQDSTGAGDVFLGAFMSEYLEGEDSAWCACMGSAMASLVVETSGARIEAPKREASRRAEELVDRVAKV